MTFSPYDIVMLAALVACTTMLVILYKKQKAININQDEFLERVENATKDLITASNEFSKINGEALETIKNLDRKIEQANNLIKNS